MDISAKLETLGRSAQYDLCGHCGANDKRVRGSFDRWIYPAVLPDGSTAKLLKILQTNACHNDCLYCGTRCSRDFRRTTFAPEELAGIFHELHRQKQVTGLFLSSGVQGTADAAMGRVVATAEILRRKHGFRGYIHLKVLPGASVPVIEAAARVADRISINLEAPNADRLRVIAPGKRFEPDLFSRLRYLAQLARDTDFRARSVTTQFVVGAAGENDREIVGRVWQLYGEQRLGRVYYSAYQRPDDDVTLAAPPVPLMREHRLYQVDFLFRRYRFAPQDIPYDEAGNLPLTADPKTVWAEKHPERFPMEINTAPREALLRIPGIGPIAANRIITQRAQQRLRDLRDLARIGAVAKRAAAFVLIGGRRPRQDKQQQLWGVNHEGCRL